MMCQRVIWWHYDVKKTYTQKLQFNNGDDSSWKEPPCENWSMRIPGGGVGTAGAKALGHN